MSRIEELIREKCPDGVEYKPLSDKSLFDFHYGKGNKIPEDAGGIYDVYGANGVVSHIDEYNCEDVSIIGHIGAVGMVNRCRKKCFVTYNGTIAAVVDKAKVDTQYFYYVLTGLNLASYKKGSQPFLSVSDFENIEIPVPPIQVQQEIVCILDKFTELETELQAELDARKKQRVYLINKSFEFDDSSPMVPLGEIADVQRGGSFQKKDFAEQGMSCIHYGQLYTRFGLEASKTLTYLSENFSGKHKIATKNDVVMAVTSENVDDVCTCLVWNGDEDISVSGHAAIIHSNQLGKYLVYYFNTDKFYIQKSRIAQGTKVIEVSPEKLKNVLIPIPSIEKQNKIVEKLDYIDNLCNNYETGLPAEIAARHKQYEYYRDKLLTFKRKEV